MPTLVIELCKEKKMKETGIVRRIDELGRIVIPKEMRRVLRIATGTPLEIKTNAEGGIVLVKYSVIAELKDYATTVTKALYDTMDMSAVICDTDRIISVAGLSKKQYIDAPISDALLHAITSLRPVMLNTEDGATLLPISTMVDEGVKGQIIVPITKDGDLVGGIVLLAGRSVSLNDVKVASGFANYLKLILEE